MADDTNPQGGTNSAEAFQKLLDKKNGDAMALATMLHGENLNLREKNRGLREQMPDGSVVVTKEDGELLTKIKALNLKPEEITQKIEAADTLSTENAALKKESVFRAVADAGFKHSVLKDFDTLEGGLEYEVGRETKDGKEKVSAYVVKDGKKVLLEDYAKEKRPDLLPALRVEQGQGTNQRGYVPQPSGGRASAGNMYDEIRNEVKEQKKNGSASKSWQEQAGLAPAR